MNLWIDDVRLPPTDWLWAEDYDQAIHYIEMYGDKIDLISFDHDLGDQRVPEKTGYDVLLYIVQMKYDGKPIPKAFNVHSANPVGRDRMSGVIERYLSE
jgi:hypothetical protein